MAIDWEQFNSELDDILDTAEEEVNAVVKERSLAWLPLTEGDITDLIPEPADAKHLAELMKVVKSAESDNNKISAIFSKSEEFGRIVLKLLDRFTRLS